jgi:Arc/MetJ family transcription regulator
MDLDDKLLDEAKAFLRARTKKEAVERSLEEIVRQKHLRALLDRQGKGFGLTLRQLYRMRRDE